VPFYTETKPKADYVPRLSGMFGPLSTAQTGQLPKKKDLDAIRQSVVMAQKKGWKAGKSPASLK